tara:strand:+ start:1273 stop:1704 length:432 start_codon:yes stop_codon:yes gene_type:complete
MNKFFTCVDSYISKKECEKYIEMYNTNLSSTYTYNDTIPLKIKSDQTVTRICNDFGIKNKLDNLEIVKREEGSFMENHFDKGDTLAFILYLNENLKGGQTVFENETIIYPKKGRLLLFSNGLILHKVEKIIEGTRYVLAGWFI